MGKVVQFLDAFYLVLRPFNLSSLLAWRAQKATAVQFRRRAASCCFRDHARDKLVLSPASSCVLASRARGFQTSRHCIYTIGGRVNGSTTLHAVFSCVSF